MGREVFTFEGDSPVNGGGQLAAFQGRPSLLK